MKDETICEFSESCAFFNDKTTNKIIPADLFKKMYCHEYNGYCARYMLIITLGIENVPADLYPHQINRVTPLISEKRNDG